MPSREYAVWVAPAAGLLAADRAAVSEFARSLPAEAWDRQSEVEGWTYKHILAHLAGGNDQLFQVILRKVIAREPLDPALLNVDTDAENAARVAERVAWPIDRLLDELDETGDEVLDLLARLTEEDREYRGGAFPMAVGQFVQIVERERHDMIHLAQLRRALD